MTTYTDSKFDNRTTTPLRVYKKDGTEIAFATPFANLREVATVLRTQPGDFAADMVAAIESVRGPSNVQAAWSHKLATDAITPKAARASESIDLSAIIAMMDKAADAQKRAPRIVLAHGEDRVVLSRATDRSKAPGSVNITDGGAFGDNVWYGRIARDGTVQPSQHYSKVLPLIAALALAPEHVAGQHGVATGTCCFCARPLSDKRSRSVGYGPICAQKYGMTYGEVSSEVEAADAASRDLSGELTEDDLYDIDCMAVAYRMIGKGVCNNLVWDIMNARAKRDGHTFPADADYDDMWTDEDCMEFVLRHGTRADLEAV